MYFVVEQSIASFNRSNAIMDGITHSISQRKWDKVGFLLADAAKTNHYLTNITRNLILHYACQFNAPLRTMMELSRTFPTSLDATDVYGRYPIHLAVSYGCSLDVIRFLIQRKPSGAGAQDAYGKTPLHYIGDLYGCYLNAFLHNYFDMIQFEDVVRDALLVVELLVKAAPQSINVEDEEEMNPIEYALLGASNIKVIKKMQKASRMEWRKQKMEKQRSDEGLANDDCDRLSETIENLHGGSLLLGKRRHHSHPCHTHNEHSAASAIASV